MFGKIKGLFEKDGSIAVDASGEPTSEDLKLATAVLLLEMAGKDNDYAPEEVQSIADTLRKQFGGENEEVIVLLERADSLREHGQKFDNFVEMINQHFSPLQKRTVMAMLWRVVVADGSVDTFEERFTTQTKYRLHLTDQDVEEAKQMVRQGLV